MNQILELSDKNFKAAITKKCSYRQLQIFLGQTKIRKHQQRNICFKKWKL